MAGIVAELTNPHLVARFQRWCGVELVVEDRHHHQDGSGRSGTADRPTDDDNHHNALRSADRSSDRPADEKPTHNNNNNNNDKTGLLSYSGFGHVLNGKLNQEGDAGSRLNGMRQSLDSFADENGSVNSERCPVWERKRGGGLVNGVAKGATIRPQNPGVEGKSATRVVIRYPALYYWARVGAFLGNEEFYLTGLPFIVWAVDSVLLRQMVVLWWLVMYLGQAAKDYFAWPRPPSPPVVRLETTHLAEYSMPSTHAMAGTAIPLLLSKLMLDRYQVPTVPVMCVAYLWCFTTCLSRLYLGVHSVLDVLSGFLVSLVLYFVVSPLTAGYDLYQQTHPLAPLVLIFTSLALCTICYPSGNGKTSGKRDAITTTAVVVGMGIGVWLNYQLGLSQLTPNAARLPVTPPTLVWLGKSLLQMGVGVAVVYGAKKVVKRVAVTFFAAFFGLDRRDAQHPGVMLGSTYVTYVCIGLTIAFLNPMLFTWLGFGRPGYYQEVL